MAESRVVKFKDRLYAVGPQFYGPMNLKDIGNATKKSDKQLTRENMLGRIVNLAYEEAYQNAQKMINGKNQIRFRFNFETGRILAEYKDFTKLGGMDCLMVGLYLPGDNGEPSFGELYGVKCSGINEGGRYVAMKIEMMFSPGQRFVEGLVNSLVPSFGFLEREDDKDRKLLPPKCHCVRSDKYIPPIEDVAQMDMARETAEEKAIREESEKRAREDELDELSYLPK